MMPRGEGENMNFFICLEPEQLKKLQDAGVAFCNFEHGVLIENTELENALVALGAELAGESPTEWSGVRAIQLRLRTTTPPPKATVVFEGPNLEAKEVILPSLETFASRVGCLVRVTNPHSDPSRVSTSEEEYHVRFWSAPEGRRQTKVHEIFGYRTHNGQYDALSASDDPTARVLRDPAGTPYAELVGRTCYVLFDLPHIREGNTKLIAEALFEAVWAEMSMTPEERAERESRAREEMRKRSRERYISECTRRFDKTLAGTKDTIERGHVAVRNLQEQIVRQIRETTGAERKLAQLEASRPEMTSAYGKEFDRLLAVPKVKNVQVVDGVVKVFTDTLYCVDPRSGKRHEIGAFRIEIVTSNGDVRWHNLTRTVSAYWEGSNAPHVSGSGHACLGSMAEIIPELVGNYEFAALALVAIQFVESVNTDDPAGKYIDRWPVADK